MKKNIVPKKIREPESLVSGKKHAQTGIKAIKPPGSGKANRYLYLFFFLFAFLLYGNTVLNKYAVDDSHVTNNDLVKKGFKALPEIFKTRYINQQGNIGSTASDYRPVVKATFAVEYQLWGDKPGRSHVLNVLIYWALSILLFSVLRRILTNYNILFPFLVTLVFMAHPVHTEVVASLKNRDELLAFLCGLGSLRLIFMYADTRKVKYMLLSIPVFFLGYLSKSSILPFILLIPLSLYFFANLPVKRLVGLLVVMFIVVLVAQLGPKLWLANVQRENFFIENPLFLEKNLWLRLGTGLVSLIFYIKLLIYPHPLLYYYGFNMIPLTNLLNFWAILSLILHAGLLFYAIRNLKSRSVISFSILWYLIAIAMYSNILVPVVGIVGERFVFAASLGFCILLIILIFRLFKTDPKSLTIEMDSRLKILTLLMLILIPYSVLSVTRNLSWRNLFVLYRSDIRHLENSAKANIDYAGFLMNSVYQDENFLRSGAVNQFKYAIITSHFRRALELYPDNYKTTNDLGTVYLFIGKNYDSAVYFLQKAIALDSSLQPAWVNLGMAYREKKEYEKAIDCYEHILRVNPSQIKAIFALANVYNDMGDFDRAVRMNEDMMKKYPNLEMPYVNIGNYHMLRKDTVNAVAYWEKAVAIRPSFELCVQLNSLYLIRRDRAKADYYYDLGIQLSKQGQ
jgi:tetratricopeptide (TPR) repeat protein